MYYFVWTIVIGIIFYWGLKLKMHLEAIAAFEFNLLPVVLFTVIFPIVLGVLLRLPRLIIEIRENKKWAFDWAKLIAVGVPTLLILILHIIPYLELVIAPYFIIIGGTTLPTIAGIVFGYILLDSLKS